MTRKKLPNEREGVTHRFVIGGEHKGYITTGHYEDGRVGEVFVKMSHQGSQVSGWADAWSILFSMSLQSGIELKELCNKFRGMRFEPAGMTDNPDIRIANSPIDYIARWLEMRFVDQEIAEPAPARVVKERPCELCGSEVNVHLYRGKYACQPCREGKVAL